MVLYVIGVLISPGFKQFMHRDLNLLITMIIGGLWHGSTQNFVIWGTMNGLALIIYKYWKKVSPYENSNWFIVHFWKIFLTFNFITFTRIWFRLKGNDEPMEMLDHIWNHFNFTWQALWTVLWNYGSVFIIIALGFFTHWMPQRWKDGIVGAFTSMPVALQMVSVSVTILLMYQAVSDSFKPFVYFEF